MLCYHSYSLTNGQETIDSARGCKRMSTTVSANKCAEKQGQNCLVLPSLRPRASWLCDAPGLSCFPASLWAWLCCRWSSDTLLKPIASALPSRPHATFRASGWCLVVFPGAIKFPLNWFTSIQERRPCLEKYKHIWEEFVNEKEIESFREYSTKQAHVWRLSFLEKKCPLQPSVLTVCTLKVTVNVRVCR